MNHSALSLLLILVVALPFLLVQAVVIVDQEVVVLKQRQLIGEKESEIAALEESKKMLEHAKSSLEAQVAVLEEEKKHLNDENWKLGTRLNRLELKRPTMQELQAFLSADTGDSRSFVNPTHVCMHYAQELKIAAQNAGWNMSLVVANIEVTLSISDSETETARSGHGFNSVILADGQTVYVEPQTDGIYATPDSLINDMFHTDAANTSNEHSDERVTVLHATIVALVTVW